MPFYYVLLYMNSIVVWYVYFMSVLAFCTSRITVAQRSQETEEESGRRALFSTLDEGCGGAASVMR